MITFQKIINEVRKEKESIVQGLLECIQNEHRDYNYFNVIALLNEDKRKPIIFYVGNEIVNAYYIEPNVKLFTICLDDEGGELPSLERLSDIFDEQLVYLEQLVNAFDQ